MEKRVQMILGDVIPTNNFNIATPKYGVYKAINNNAIAQIDCGFRAKKVVYLARNSSSNVTNAFLVVLDLETKKGSSQWSSNAMAELSETDVENNIPSITDTSFTLKNVMGANGGFIIFAYDE